MSKVIRLHRFGGNEVLRADDVEQSQPDAGEVLVAVRAASASVEQGRSAGKIVLKVA
jgi:NADPH:quinone reductase-like Zn-dependent oxidoreductase